MLIDYPAINDFSLCRQTVTLYRYEAGEVTRTEYPRAYFEQTDKTQTNTTGEELKTAHLVVIPGAIECAPGDKVYLGVGDYPDGDIQKWWRNFIPAKYPECVIVRSVSVRHWLGKPSHTELRG